MPTNPGINVSLSGVILKSQKMKTNLANNIKFLCKKHKLTQGAFGELIGATGATVSNWTNKVSLPPIDKIIAISLHFNISLNDLILGELALAKFAKQYPGAQSLINQIPDPKEDIADTILKRLGTILQQHYNTQHGK